MIRAFRFWSGFVLALAVLMAVSAVSTIAFADSLPQGAYAHQQIQRQQAQSVWGLNAPISTLAAQVHQESGWNCNAVSPVGALGCTQFMPATANDIARRYPADLHPVNPRNPRWAYRAQAQYMKSLYEGRGARGAVNRCEQMAFALSAYNGGEGWVIRDRALADRQALPYGRFFGAAQRVNAGRAPAYKRENAEYPQRILLKVEPRYVRAGFGAGSC